MLTQIHGSWTWVLCGIFTWWKVPMVTEIQPSSNQVRIYIGIHMVYNTHPCSNTCCRLTSVHAHWQAGRWSALLESNATTYLQKRRVGGKCLGAFQPRAQSSVAETHLFTGALTWANDGFSNPEALPPKLCLPKASKQTKRGQKSHKDATIPEKCTFSFQHERICRQRMLPRLVSERGTKSVVLRAPGPQSPSCLSFSKCRHSVKISSGSR